MSLQRDSERGWADSAPGFELNVRASHGSPRALMNFHFGAGNDGGLRTGLTALGGFEAESWSAAVPAEHAQLGDIDCRQAGDFGLLVLARPDDGQSDPAPLVEQAYRDLFKLAKARGLGHLLRAWNYLPGINRGHGDAERYRRFCLGRAQALDAAGLAGLTPCAATAIGSNEPWLRVFLLFGGRPGVPIENPRQVSAYRYPRRYGPSSPFFARATAVGPMGGPVMLMISGTASVVGHETRHPGNVSAQCGEIVANLEALLNEGARRMNCPALSRFDRHSLIRVYLRCADDWPAVRERLQRAWPDAWLTGLHGDICRRELLVEIEAVSFGRRDPGAGPDS